MKFAKIVFYAAGVWGIAVLTPLYFSTAVLDRVPSPPVADPQFFYGFLSVTMTFQLVFLVIGSNPARFRPLMFPSVIEKFGFIASMAVLYALGRVTRTEFITTLPDLVLGLLFTSALIKTRAGALPHGHDRWSVDYYVDPIPKARLVDLLRKMRMTPRELLRTSEAIYKNTPTSSSGRSSRKVGARFWPDPPSA